ncbi:cytochrome c biogenesis protein ResB [Tumebacillus permanentifrigoris]|uniref:Cytochrome c biogenesis protein n=1 Tax=Tumebacillus permanentifrigoris TaxID=378543 RepID=A0A316DBQ2_9BACL|nr:cytochrome c biogenesis protein ResB [Tumebacillus permanentifrigoris]PWK14430.1 cytochrome c biogenesis protein [Tumebacillus permanentifrigoris]
MNNGKQTSVFDTVWDFFASVKVGVTIIVLIAVGSAIGTIYPQTNAIPSPNPEFYYMDTYGKLGDFYYRIGLADTFGSWWFLALVLLLAISLVIVSIDRGVPLYKSLKNQPVARKVIALRTDRLYTHAEDADESKLEELAQHLKKRRYKVRREGDALLAEKGRFPRFGAYVLHMGLIVIILGVFSRLIPGWYYTDMIWLKEGETKTVGNLGFEVQNNGFELEFYDNEQTRVKRFETDAVVYKNGQEMAKKHLLVNDYLTFEHANIYQNSYDPQPMFKVGTIDLIDNTTQKSVGTFTINFDDPQPSYKVGEYTLTMANYFPDIKIDPEKGVFTNSRDPYNPGIQFDITGPDLSEPARQWMMPLAGPFVKQMLGKDYRFDMQFKDVDFFHMTGLKIEKDLGTPIVYTGLGIVLYGLVLCFYFQHRRVWARLEAGVLHIGANTNKNWLGMTGEMKRVLVPLGIEPMSMKRKEEPQQP